MYEIGQVQLCRSTIIYFMRRYIILNICFERKYIRLYVDSKFISPYAMSVFVSLRMKG